MHLQIAGLRKQQCAEMERSIFRIGLSSPTEFAQLSESEKANIFYVLGLFEPQRHLLRHFLRLSFTVAGLFWFVLWFPQLAALDAEQLAQFKTQQYQLYLVLLTLWGIDLKRHSKRLAFLLRLSALQNKRWYELSAEELRQSQHLHLFELLWKLPDNPNRRIWHLLLPYGLILLAVVLLVLQFLLLFH